jgi:hypothetical protein
VHTGEIVTMNISLMSFEKIPYFGFSLRLHYTTENRKEATNYL